MWDAYTDWVRRRGGTWIIRRCSFREDPDGAARQCGTQTGFRLMRALWQLSEAAIKAGVPRRAFFFSTQISNAPAASAFSGGLLLTLDEKLRTYPFPQAEPRFTRKTGR